MKVFWILIMVGAALSCQLFALETITVDATGVGATAQAAEKAALTNAVQQAVGLFLDSETLVKNEQIIYDSILSLSDGFVTKYDVKTPPRQRPLDGLFETTISAVVQKGKIGAELKKRNLIQAVDTKDAWAQAVTTVRSSQDAIDVLTRLLPDMITGLLEARFLAGENQKAGDIRPEIKPDPTTGHAWCAWNVKIGYDHEGYYDKAVPLLQKAFDAIADRQLPDFTLQAPTAVVSRDPNYGRTIILGTPARSPKMDVRFPVVDSRNEFIICLNYAADTSRQNLRFHAWAVDRKLYERWLKDLFTPRKLKISFLDDRGEVVVDDELALSSTLLMPKTGAVAETQAFAGIKTRVLEPPLVWWGQAVLESRRSCQSCWVVPDFLEYPPVLFLDSLVIRCEVSLDPDDIKKLKSAQLAFVPAQS
ncbi:MAG TPA: hypothetical protein VGD78_20105 [Chthoniobacterales bacterium]